MKLGLTILSSLSLLFTFLIFLQIYKSVPASDTPFVKKVKLQEGLKFDFEIQFDGRYEICFLPKEDIGICRYSSIKSKLIPHSDFQERVKFIDKSYQIGTFLGENGDDFQLQILKLDKSLINKEVILSVSPNDAMPSHNLYWANELRPLFTTIFKISLIVTLVLSIFTTYVIIKRKEWV